MHDATKVREWSPHLCVGYDFFAWMSLLARNRFAVHPSLWYVAGITTGVSFGHTVLRWLQHGQYGRRIAATRIDRPPIFIVGHWRTGTTMLHEWMILDERFTFPNTYQCLVPGHLLLTEKFFRRWMNWLLPDRRPMDNMEVGWGRPQEDEFALGLLGAASPYADIHFPNRPPLDPASLSLDGLPPRRLAEWRRIFRRYVQTLTFRDPRRLVMKSPPHMARIPHLLELFPGAKFVHIMRNPYAVFSSTVNLWKKLYTKHGLQKPDFAHLEERVLKTFTQMYSHFEDGRKCVPEGQFHEIRYEELVADPAGQMGALYERLDLGGFAEYLPRLEESLRRNAGYEVNRWKLDADSRAKVRGHWGEVIDRYGYAEPT